MVGAYWRGEITLRKLRVLVDHLPVDSAASWSSTDGHPWSQESALLWRMIWELQGVNVKIAQLGGNRRAKMPADKMPRFPWSRPDEDNPSSFGAVPEGREAEALSYLDSL